MMVMMILISSTFNIKKYLAEFPTFCYLISKFCLKQRLILKSISLAIITTFCFLIDLKSVGTTSEKLMQRLDILQIPPFFSHNFSDLENSRLRNFVILISHRDSAVTSFLTFLCTLTMNDKRNIRNRAAVSFFILSRRWIEYKQMRAMKACSASSDEVVHFVRDCRECSCSSFFRYSEAVSFRRQFDSQSSKFRVFSEARTRHGNSTTAFHQTRHESIFPPDWSTWHLGVHCKSRNRAFLHKCFLVSGRHQREFNQNRVRGWNGVPLQQPFVQLQRVYLSQLAPIRSSPKNYDRSLFQPRNNRRHWISCRRSIFESFYFVSRSENWGKLLHALSADSSGRWTRKQREQTELGSRRLFSG